MVASIRCLAALRMTGNVKATIIRVAHLRSQQMRELYIAMQGKARQQRQQQEDTRLAPTVLEQVALSALRTTAKGHSPPPSPLFNHNHMAARYRTAHLPTRVRIIMVVSTIQIR